MFECGIQSTKSHMVIVEAALHCSCVKSLKQLLSMVLQLLCIQTRCILIVLYVVFVWQVAEAQIEYNCFQALQQQELLAAPDRIERMRLLVKGQRQREAELQQRYKQLCQQREDMREELAQQQQQQPGGQGASKLAAAAGAVQATPVAS